LTQTDESEGLAISVIFGSRELIRLLYNQVATIVCRKLSAEYCPEQIGDLMVFNDIFVSIGA